MSIFEFDTRYLDSSKKKYFEEIEEIKKICKEIKELKKDLKELKGKESLSEFKKDFEFVEKISKLVSSCTCEIKNNKSHSIKKMKFGKVKFEKKKSGEFHNKIFMELLITKYFFI